ncbi:MAG: hypothetical protein CFK52_06985 [Chloracidobacterium sp. CP2_5A]|nr:MAG: hypothetical protein CFK52_06985 [Chloracidobacterium sp. CP2_5A]
MQPFPLPPPYAPSAPAKKSSKAWLWALGGCGCLSILAIAVIAVALLLSASGGGIPSDKQAYVGDWSGENTTLSISPDGRVTWEARQGNARNSVTNLPIKRFIADDFEVGFLFLTTRFKVQRPPKLVAGRWTMTVEGRQLSRSGDGPAGGSDDNGGAPGDGTTTTGNLREIKMARLSSDNDDMTFTTSFNRSDTKITCVIYPRELSVGENYETRWYAERVPKLTANKLIGEVSFPTITPETSRLSGIRLSLTSDDGFPSGLYRVEVLQDGQTIGTARFTVN